jgi:hypothetical protein
MLKSIAGHERQRYTRRMRALVVSCPLAFTVLAALAACVPSPKAQQQQMSGCGGDQGMATQFYDQATGAPRMGPSPKCPS